MNLKNLVSRIEIAESLGIQTQTIASGNEKERSRSERVSLRPAHSLRPRRSAPRARAAQSAVASTGAAARQTQMTTRRARQRLVGFEYEPETGTAHFSMYVPGSAGRERKRATVRASS